jgi:RNA-directed DNA polymerase
MDTQEVTMDIYDEVSTKMRQIATNARNLPQVGFTSLAYHIDLKWLYEAFKETRKGGLTGVDNQTGEDYAKDLKANLERLLEEAMSGRYKAPPVRRVYIPKGNGEKRPLGVTTFEDKVLQRAVYWILEPLYEQDFYDCSYGFRRRRSQHMAVEALWAGLMKKKGAWIIDLDIRKFYDSIGWNYLCEILKLRVRDGVIVRLIGKWMNAGVMEECKGIYYPELGVQQGGVISPILSNIFLHEVLDKWFHEVVIPRLKGKAFEVRYADDAVLCFENREDAERVLAVLPKRLAKYGLELHPEKTKLVNFKRPRADKGSTEQGNRPGTFDFLGFTHFWRKSRKGNSVIGRKTSSSRLTKAIRKVYEWCKKNRHQKIREQHEKLIMKIKGHYNYYGICGNFRSLVKFFRSVERAWYKWLKRRSNKRNLIWEKYNRLLQYYKLPSPVIIHPNT